MDQIAEVAALALLDTFGVIDATPDSVHDEHELVYYFERLADAMEAQRHVAYRLRRMIVNAIPSTTAPLLIRTPNILGSMNNIVRNEFQRNFGVRLDLRSGAFRRAFLLDSHSTVFKVARSSAGPGMMRDELELMDAMRNVPSLTPYTIQSHKITERSASYERVECVHFDERAGNYVYPDGYHTLPEGWRGWISNEINRFFANDVADDFHDENIGFTEDGRWVVVDVMRRDSRRNCQHLRNREEIRIERIGDKALDYLQATGEVDKAANAIIRKHETIQAEIRT